MEKIFFLSFCYKIKVVICNYINPVQRIALDKWIMDKRVINLGCGPVNYSYDENLTKLNIGVDKSSHFIRYIAGKKLCTKSRFLITDVCHLPFKNKTFDTAVSSFLIHHVPVDHKKILKEINRVTRDYVIISDHVLANDGLRSFIQRCYWMVFDRGAKYNKQAEWDDLLKAYKVIRHARTGVMFKNICQYVLKINKTEQTL